MPCQHLLLLFFRSSHAAACQTLLTQRCGQAPWRLAELQIDTFMYHYGIT
ncbi:hypothetical protein M758_7G174600 [Ceratodon purpureus]|uniref:Uncharacterized protein n=1 Tax=Ceratodon purpureus TaxID=3225 RepID=A0A8T0H9P8_CERPU|nr:hypothetical protein KC19_7G177700 [Ceratodon purpureus]KAG0611901.1 hypothetical protein M758_7G174600 [Ceratodon purpureus]